MNKKKIAEEKADPNLWQKEHKVIRDVCIWLADNLDMPNLNTNLDKHGESSYYIWGDCTLFLSPGIKTATKTKPDLKAELHIGDYFLMTWNVNIPDEVKQKLIREPQTLDELLERATTRC